MAVRISESKFLEVLESDAALGVPIEVDVFSGANPATMLATLDGAFGKRFTRELSELGSGGFTLARTDPKATPDILAVGNLVKFRVAGTHRHAIWIEEPATTLVSGGEEGGEDVAINGRGALAYIERATVYPPVWPTAAAAAVAWSSADNGSTGTTSLVVSKPTGSLAGDVVVVTVLCVGATPSTPTGWKLVRNVTNGTLRAAMFRKRLLASEPASWTWHWSAATKATGAAVTLRNAASDDTAWGISDTTGSGTAVELPSVSVGLVDGVLLTFAGSAASTAFTPGAGLTEIVDRAATGRTLEVAHLTNPALGDTGDLTATAGSSAAWIGLQVVVPSTASADAIFDGATFGSVLATLINEAQARGAMPALTYDFTATVDSHGQPWPDVHDLSFHVGTSLLEVWRHLVTLGLEGGMTPELRLQAYVDASRRFESTVILRKGHHFSGNVIDTAHASGLRTRVLIEGAGGRVVEVTDPVAEIDAHIGRREGYLSLSTSDNATTLQRAGEVALASAAAEDQARSIVVEHGPASQGQFEPWVDYREGDWIGIDAEGSGGVAEAQRVVSITLEETDGGDFSTELELNSVEMDAFLRLQRRLDALSRDTTASGSGGSSGGGTSAASGRVASVATDSPGYLFDKIATDSTLAKSLVGATGSQRVQLSVAPGGTHPNLATHDALGLATDAELATHAGAADPHTGYQRESEKGAASGYAPLDSGVLVPIAYLPVGTGAGQVAAGNHGHAHSALTGIGADDHHARQHSATSAPDHTFPGGTTNFLRADGTFAAPPGGASLTVADEGTPLATAATTLDFVGAGVTASGAGATKTITISGGGSGVTVEEVDGTPTVTATKLVLPNGTLGVVGTVATYTPAGGSGVSLGSATPLVESGSGSAGTAGNASREDHVHPAGGGGTAYAFPLDVPPGSAHAKDDEFPGSSLDAKWTNPAGPSGATITVVDGWMTINPGASPSTRGGYAIRQTAPAGSFTIMAKVVDRKAGDDARAGIFVARTTGGQGHILGNQRQNGRVANANGFSSYSEAGAWGAYDGYDQYVAPGWPAAVWYRIRWDTGSATLFFDYSVDGIFWTALSTRAGQSQPDRIGLALWSNTGNVGANHLLSVDWFRVTEP